MPRPQHLAPGSPTTSRSVRTQPTGRRRLPSTPCHPPPPRHRERAVGAKRGTGEELPPGARQRLPRHEARNQLQRDDLHPHDLHPRRARRGPQLLHASSVSSEFTTLSERAALTSPWRHSSCANPGRRSSPMKNYRSPVTGLLSSATTRTTPRGAGPSNSLIQPGRTGRAGVARGDSGSPVSAARLKYCVDVARRRRCSSYHIGPAVLMPNIGSSSKLVARSRLSVHHACSTSRSTRRNSPRRCGRHGPDATSPPM